MDTKSNLQTNQKLEHIDSLRGVAILMVILVHTAQLTPRMSHRMLEIATLGQLGVQLFFVVSAITLSLSADHRVDEKNRYKKFIIRRFFRIAPLYYIGIVWYFVFRSIKFFWETGSFQPANGYTLQNILANFFFIHGFYPPANNNIVPGGWSIGTEMAFYLCFPILFILFKKLASLSPNQMISRFALIIGFYYFLEYRYTIWAGVDITTNEFIYSNLLNQLPVFLVGLLAYLLIKNQFLEKIPLIINIFFLCLFTFITLALWRSDLTLVSPFMFIPFTVGIAFIFLYNLFAGTRLLNFSILQRIGQLSYSMYIWHFMFAWYFLEYLNGWFGYKGKPITVLAGYYILVVLFSFILGIFSEKFIEKPGINFGRKLLSKIDEYNI
jgi:peptidoglycan/LPS O-acetylase OafA/YrhL